MGKGAPDGRRSGRRAPLPCRRRGGCRRLAFVAAGRGRLPRVLQGVPASESADWNTGDTDCPSSGRGVGPIGADDRAVPELSPGGPGQQVGAGQFLAYHVRVDADPLAPTSSDLSADLAFTGISGESAVDLTSGVLCAFVDDGDPLNTSPGATAALRSSTPSADGKRLAATIDVKGVEAGASAVVELWLKAAATQPRSTSVFQASVDRVEAAPTTRARRHDLHRSAGHLLPAEPRHRGRAGRTGRRRPGAGSGRAAHDARAQHRRGRRRPRRRRPLQGRPEPGDQRRHHQRRGRRRHHVRALGRRGDLHRSVPRARRARHRGDRRHPGRGCPAGLRGRRPGLRAPGAGPLRDGRPLHREQPGRATGPGRAGDRPARTRLHLGHQAGRRRGRPLRGPLGRLRLRRRRRHATIRSRASPSSTRRAHRSPS